MNKPISLESIETAGKEFDQRIREILSPSSSYENDHDRHNAHSRALHAEIRRLTGQAKTLCSQNASSESELAEARSEISRLAEENGALSVAPGGVELRDLRVRAERAESNVSRLEGLCGVRGIDPSQAVQAADFKAEVSEAAMNEKLELAKTPEERAAIISEVEKAIKEKRLSA